MTLKSIKLIVDGNKHLGNLVLIKLSNGNHCLKISFRNKVDLFNSYNPHIGTLDSTVYLKPHSVKEIEGGENLEVSYHFENSRLEIKQESDGIDRKLYNVEKPINNYLFTFFIKDKQGLAKVDLDEECIILNKENLGEQIAVIFSFMNDQGKWFIHSGLQTLIRGSVHKVPLEGMILEHIVIATVADNHPIGDGNNFLISTPHYLTKMSKDK